VGPMASGSSLMPEDFARDRAEDGVMVANAASGSERSDAVAGSSRDASGNGIEGGDVKCEDVGEESSAGNSSAAKSGVEAEDEEE